MKIMDNSDINDYIYELRKYTNDVYIEDKENLIEKVEQVLRMARLLGYQFFASFEDGDTSFSMGLNNNGYEIIYGLIIKVNKYQSSVVTSHQNGKTTKAFERKDPFEVLDFLVELL